MDFKKLVNSVKNEACDAVETTKFKAKISKEKTDIRENYQKLGEMLYKAYKESGVASEEYMDIMGDIDESRAKITRYNAEIEKIKNCQQ